MDDYAASLDERENNIAKRENDNASETQYLSQEKAKLKQAQQALKEKEDNLDTEVHNCVLSIIKEKLTHFFDKFIVPIFKRFEGRHQKEVLAVLDQMPIDATTAGNLQKIGYPDFTGQPYEAVLDYAEEKDIYELLHEKNPSITEDMLDTDKYNCVIEAIKNGDSVENAINTMAEKLAQDMAPVAHRRRGR